MKKITKYINEHIIKGHLQSKYKLNETQIKSLANKELLYKGLIFKLYSYNDRYVVQFNKRINRILNKFEYLCDILNSLGNNKQFNTISVILMGSSIGFSFSKPNENEYLLFYWGGDDKVTILQKNKDNFDDYGDEDILKPKIIQLLKTL